MIHYNDHLMYADQLWRIDDLAKLILGFVDPMFMVLGVMRVCEQWRRFVVEMLGDDLEEIRATYKTEEERKRITCERMRWWSIHDRGFNLKEYMVGSFWFITEDWFLLNGIEVASMTGSWERVSYLNGRIGYALSVRDIVVRAVEGDYLELVQKIEFYLRYTINHEMIRKSTFANAIQCFKYFVEKFRRIYFKKTLEADYFRRSIISGSYDVFVECIRIYGSSSLNSSCFHALAPMHTHGSLKITRYMHDTLALEFPNNFLAECSKGSNEKFRYVFSNVAIQRDDLLSDCVKCQATCENIKFLFSQNIHDETRTFATNIAVRNGDHDVLQILKDNGYIFYARTILYCS